MLLQFDGTLFVILISFIVFAVVMQKIFYVPMRTLIENRDNYISGNHEEAKNAAEKSAKILEEYRNKIREARLSSQQTIDQLTGKGKEEKSKILNQASSVVVKESQMAQELLDKEKDGAIEELIKEVSPLAQQIVSKVLGTTVAISGIDYEKVNKLMKG